jgi:hypothetical protein
MEVGMAALKKVFCVGCSQELLSTFQECPNCGGEAFSDLRPARASFAATQQASSPAARVTTAFPPPPQMRGSASPAPAGVKHCAKCGARLQTSSVECPACGAAAIGTAPPIMRGPAGPPKSGIAAEPVIPRNETNIISRCERERDRIYDELTRACDAEGVQGMLLKSWPFDPNVWVKCECWLPHEQGNRLRERVSATITIRGREFHRFEFEIDVEVVRGDKTRKHLSVIRFTQQTARQIVQYLLHRAEALDFSRCRTRLYELWLPGNRANTRTDPLAIAGGLAFLAGAAFLAIPLSDLGPLIGLICLAIGAGCGFVSHHRRRRLYVFSAGKPSQEPRYLILKDSWQTLINDIAGDAQRVRTEVWDSLRQSQPDGAALSSEKTWYHGLDGKVEREQIVMIFRRAIAFVHIYPDGGDLYVGWVAHLNRGAWAEKLVGVGLDPATGAPCQLKTIEAGTQALNEYDLIDGNVLSERVHAAIVKVIKRILVERKIDQEIDFKILREERKGIVDQADDKKKGR